MGDDAFSWEGGEMSKGCGKKFEFMEADNVYVGECGDEDGLCHDCSQNTGSGKT